MKMENGLQTLGSSSAGAMRLQEVYRNSGACYGIEWGLRRFALYPQEIFGDCMYLDESKIARFSPGEGLVGQVFQQKESILLSCVREASKDFLRKRSALDDAIESIVFVWYECCVFEFGFRSSISEAPHVGSKTTTTIAPTLVWSLPSSIRFLSESAADQKQVPHFTPAAHHKAFLSPAFSHPDMRSEQQLPGFMPPMGQVLFRMHEVRQHTSTDDAWIVVHGNVYNITNFIKHHPGWEVGSQSSTILAILQALGKDCTVLFDAIHPDYAIRQLAEYRIGEVHLGLSEVDSTQQLFLKSDCCVTRKDEGHTLAAPSVSMTFMDFMSSGSGLVAAHTGGTSLAQLCSVASGLRNALREDSESSRVLESKACFITYPHDEPWGLTASLDAIGLAGAQFHEDASFGACVIGKSGLRSGRAAFHFLVQDFAGAFIGLTTCAPASRIDQVLNAQASTLFSVGGGLLHSMDKIYDPGFNRWQDHALSVTVTIVVDMSGGSISFVASGDHQTLNQVDVSRPEWQPLSSHALFPVIFATPLSLSQFQSGSAICQRIVS